MPQAVEIAAPGAVRSLREPAVNYDSGWHSASWTVPTTSKQRGDDVGKTTQGKGPKGRGAIAKWTFAGLSNFRRLFEGKGRQHHQGGSQRFDEGAEGSHHGPQGEPPFLENGTYPQVEEAPLFAPFR